MNLEFIDLAEYLVDSAIYGLTVTGGTSGVMYGTSVINNKWHIKTILYRDFISWHQTEKVNIFPILDIMKRTSYADTVELIRRHLVLLSKPYRKDVAIM